MPTAQLSVCSAPPAAAPSVGATPGGEHEHAGAAAARAAPCSATAAGSASGGCRRSRRGRGGRARAARVAARPPAPARASTPASVGRRARRRRCTAARRSGGRPPSHSHWSITFGQIRSVTAAASCGEACSTFGKVSGGADADAHLVRADAPAAADGLGADDGDGHDGRAGLEREAADAALGAAERAGADARALGEDQDAVAAREDRLGGREHVLVAGAALDREGAERVEEPARRRGSGTARDLAT